MDIDGVALQTKLDAIPMFQRAIIFTMQGQIVTSTVFPAPSVGELQSIVAVMEGTPEAAVDTGICVQGDYFEVQSFTPPIISGRRGNPDHSEGVGIIRGTHQDTTVFFLVSYVLPNLAPRVIPRALQFFRENVGEVDLHIPRSQGHRTSGWLRFGRGSPGGRPASGGSRGSRNPL
mmetsp:Transcript_47520/g.125742  ORF Transcript_47520/g.125742 Transcript_47520/m.125742 type:complete len:175 (+) Transcript_47520:80-604(+)